MAKKLAWKSFTEDPSNMHGMSRGVEGHPSEKATSGWTPEKEGWHLHSNQGGGAGHPS